MAGMFDDLIQQNGPTAPQKRVAFDDLIPSGAATPAPAKDIGVLGKIGDMAASVPGGLATGLHEAVMLPVTAKRAMDDYLTPLEAKYVINPVQKMLGYQPSTVDELLGRGSTVGNIDSAIYADQDRARAELDNTFYQPKTLPGKFVKTGSEFIGGGGFSPSAATRTAGTFAAKATNYAGDIMRNGFVPGVTSEAGGQAAQALGASPTTEAIVRIITGGGANVLGNAVKAASASESVMRRVLAGTTPEDFDAMRALQAKAAGQGITLSGPELHAHINDGASAATNALRVVEGSVEGRAATAPFFRQRAPQVNDAVTRMLDTVGPQSDNPAMLAPTMNQAAEAALKASPEGQALQEAIFRAGPRTTPLQAGEVIQPELSNVFQRREGMRNALSDVAYEDARKAAPTIPVADMQPKSHLVEPSATRLDPNVDIFGQSEMAPTAIPAKTEVPSLRSNTGPDFVQTDPRNAVKDIRALAANEAGEYKNLLSDVADQLYTDGAISTSVPHLESVRGSLNDKIAAAKAAGQGHAVELLSAARAKVDEALSTSPEFAAANKQFAAASAPLGPFESPGMSSVIKRNDVNTKFTTPPEDVVAAIMKPSEAKNFNSVASTPARDAMQNQLATKIMDGVTDAQGNVNPEALAIAIRDNADMLDQFPEVRKRLEAIVPAGRTLETSRAGPVGQVAAAKTTEGVGNAILPDNPSSGSAAQQGRATADLVAQDPLATSQTVRQNLGDRWSKASTATQEGTQDFGGAKFRKNVAGNKDMAAVLDAVLRNLPGGDQIANSVNDTLDILHATGRRKAIGSATEFNRALNADLGSASPAAKLLTAVRSLGGSILTGANDEAKRMVLRNSLGRLADMFTAPDTVDQMQQAMQRSVPIGVGEALSRTAAQSSTIEARKKREEKK